MARSNVVLLVLVTGATAAAAITGLRPGMPEWGTFLALAVAAALTQYLSNREGGTASELLSLPIVLGAALVLPPPFVALIGIAQHSLDWATPRRDARTELLAVARTTLSALAASWVVGVFGWSPGFWGMLTSVTGASVFLVSWHLLDQGAARAWSTSEAEEADLATDVVVGSIGIGLATLWHAEPWSAFFALVPLIAVHRSLQTGRLRQQADVDPKTGLFNARRLVAALESELARARRYGGPVSVIMADLDLLREVNNTYGHLAGDAVLRGVADVLRDELRPYDVPGRFGGEEFAIVLPQTRGESALEIAERIRRGVSARRYPVGGDEQVRVTISLGVASYPADAGGCEGLLHRADLAVYRAKLQGRNRVHAASDDPVATPPPLRLATTADAGAWPLQPTAPPTVPRVRARPSRSEVVDWLLPRVVPLGLGALLVAAVAGVPKGALAFATAMLLPALLIRRARWSTSEQHADRAHELWRAAETLHAQTRTIERDNRLLRESSTAAMETLSAIVDARDAHTAGHSRRVERIALALGRELTLSEAELDVLSKAALLHDIGKLSVPEAILLKPDRLDSQEWRIVRRHPVEGARLLERLGFLADALPAVRHHHERYDGSGYPSGLAGEEIPLGARILNVADALDAMLTPRVYRPARTPLEALEELRAGAGTQFCPRCVEAVDRLALLEFQGGADPSSLELLAG